MSSPAAAESPILDLGVVGGGAAGFFGAITCAEASPGAKVWILEKGSQVLGKVKISGGGRCNVTHACFEPRRLTTFYPRGGRALTGPFHHWSPTETMAWFEERGVPLKIEADGRVFPQSDSSQSIIDCLTLAAREAGVEVHRKTEVTRVKTDEEGLFVVSLGDGRSLRFRRLLVTTGGVRTRIGAQIAEGFGHPVEPAAPSLFTFKITDARLSGLQGLSVEKTQVKVLGVGKGLEAEGPVLVTHWGLSGPGILRVSAWGARDLQQADYRFEIALNWCGGRSAEQVRAELQLRRDQAAKKGVLKDPLFGLPLRLWQRLVQHAAEGPAEDLRWAHLPKDLSRRLVEELVAGRFQVQGKSMNKDEFVTCGGVRLKDVNPKTFESRLQPGLHFAGEVLDIDGITGGFNFQAAWTTSRLAGLAVAESL